MRAIAVSLVRLGMVAVAFLLVTPGVSNAQGCLLCKLHADGTCAIPALEYHCGCCKNVGELEP